MTAVVLLAAAFIVGVFWRRSGRRLPYPASLGWLLDNPYMNAVAGPSAVLDQLAVSPGMRVLDAGCGPGRLTIASAERVGPSGEVVALDVQKAMLDRVREAATARGLTNVSTLSGDIASSLTMAGDFDRAILVTVLGEVPDPQAALLAVYTALRPGGLLAITEVIPDPDYQSRRTVRRLGEAAGFRLERETGSWLAFTTTFRRPPEPVSTQVGVRS